MGFGDLLTKLFGDPIAASAVWAVIVLCVSQFVLGSLRAWSNKTFAWSAFDAWIRTDVAGRVIPIILIFVVAKATPDLLVFGIPVESGLLAYGVLQAGTYIISGVASIKDNVRPPDPALFKAKTTLGVSLGDKIPTD
jgi:hypothetical protein